MIADIIEKQSIKTQQELQNALKNAGLHVTQATISRDIKELKIIKMRSPNGEYCYTVTARDEMLENPEKFSKLFEQAMIKAESAQNLVVVKSYAGMANAVCALIDAMKHDNIVGTIAGDDTILIVMRTTEEANALKNELGNLIK